MYTYLKQHPEIYVSLYKEPHFFGSDLTRPNFIRDEELYAHLFAGAEGKKRVGEGSILYLMSTQAAREIKAFNPDASIIIMLRNPVDMLDSLHGLFVRTGNEDVPDLETAVGLEEERKQGRRLPPAATLPQALMYKEMGCYYPKVKRFVDAFGFARVHVVVFDDFVADTAASYREVLTFLDVDPDFEAELDLEKAEKKIRPMVMEQMRHARKEIKQMLRNKMGNQHKSPARTPVRPEFRSQLMDHFIEDIEKTAQLTGKDLSRWFRSRA